VRAIWNNALAWTFQGWLAMFFAGAAYAKLTAPADHLAILLGWSEQVPLGLVRGLGALEATLALSMLLPLLARKSGHIGVVAAASFLIGLESVFLVVHLTRFEPALAFVNAILLGLTIPVWFIRKRAPS